MHWLSVILVCVLITEGMTTGDLDTVNDEGVEMNADETCLPVDTPCIVKCCAQDEILFINGTWNCVNRKSEGIDLSTIEDEWANYSAEISSNKLTGQYLYRKSQEYFNGNNFIHLTESQVVTIPENNSLYIIDGDLTVEPSLYCREMVAVLYNDTTINTYFIYLVNFDDNEEQVVTHLFFAYGSFVSAFFIFWTLVVYYLLEKLRRTMYVYLLMSFLATLMALNIVDSSETLYDRRLVEEGRDDDLEGLCNWLGPISYFLTLSTFFWMNAMCYEIWKTLRPDKPKAVRTSKLSAYKKAMYAGYAMGCPAVLTSIALMIQHLDVPESVAKPNFETCMKDFDEPLYRLYKYLPMIVLLSANIVMFSLTMRNMWKHDKKTKNITTTQSNKMINKHRAFINLSLLMGVSWLLECAQAFFSIQFPLWLTVLLNSVNVFFGLLVFLSTVCKRKIFVALCIRFNIDNRWVRASPSTKVYTSKQGHAKTMSSFGTRADDSIQFESINVDDKSSFRPSSPIRLSERGLGQKWADGTCKRI